MVVAENRDSMDDNTSKKNHPMVLQNEQDNNIQITTMADTAEMADTSMR